MSWFIAWILPAEIEMISVLAPSVVTASRGPVSSTCSTPSVARIAIRLPSSLPAMGCSSRRWRHPVRAASTTG